ncbi:MAG: CHAD domain-containing protein [Chitinophagaceae bacterium]|nr:CHAD domain-containing protein [Chitinophagaceae bacterium]
MNRKLLEKISNDHYDKMAGIVSGLLKGINQATIHRFRVEYKKLRAFFRMLSIAEPGVKRIRIQKELKNAYTIAGSIRDLQLQERRVLKATLRDSKKPRTYLNLVQEKIDKLQPELIEILSGNSIEKSRRKTGRLLPSKFLLSSFRQYVQEKWELIYAILASGNFSDSNIHIIRKNLKDLYYNVKQYTGLRQERLSVLVWKERDEAWFDKLLMELGSFQDRCNSVALLKAYWLIKSGNYNKTQLERIKKEWIKDKIARKQSLLQTIRNNFIHPPISSVK